MLLDKSANVNLFDRSGYTPLFWSSLNGSAEVSKMLINKGANPSPPSSGPQQLPSAAVEGGHDEVLTALLDKEGRPDQINVHNRTALHTASAGGHISIARLLLSTGAKPDTPDRYGRTPLFYAVCGGHIDMVRLLLMLPGVDKCRLDVWGRAPALEAQEREFHEINQLLCGNCEKVESGVESSIESDMAPSSTGEKASQFCDVCLRGISDEEEYYSCEDLNVCKRCPPVQTNSCPLCGNQLEERVCRNPVTPFWEQCVCM
jgi:hypothetical protein